MEWVETTGPSIAAALDAALDELGVDEDEVEFEVLVEPKAGLFGRLGGNPARIRARVKPISREKPGDRSRSRSRSGRRNGGRAPANGGGERTDDAPADTTAVATVPTTTAEGPAKKRRRRRGGRGGGQRAQGGTPGGGASGPAGGEAGGTSSRTAAGADDSREETEVTTTEEVPIGEQADVADEFMRGLMGAFGLAARVSVRIEGDAVFVDVEGADLGLLVGPKGATLRAIEDLVRTVVQRRTDGHGARIHVDVGGYQAKRRAALEQFAAELADRVRDSGQELALEPMPPADRKVVHDTVAAIEGVTTISEGEEPRRRVVVRPA